MKLLDTSAWVEYFKGTEKGLVVKQWLENEGMYTCLITLAEISRWFQENNGDVSTAVEQIRQNSILLPLEEFILIESGKHYVALRKLRPKIGLIDVIIYVTARIHDLKLITSDSDFKGLPQVEML